MYSLISHLSDEVFVSLFLKSSFSRYTVGGFFLVFWTYSPLLSWSIRFLLKCLLIALSELLIGPMSGLWALVGQCCSTVSIHVEFTFNPAASWRAGRQLCVCLGSSVLQVLLADGGYSGPWSGLPGTTLVPAVRVVDTDDFLHSLLQAVSRCIRHAVMLVLLVYFFYKDSLYLFFVAIYCYKCFSGLLVLHILW